jgi:hypothetical protein
VEQLFANQHWILERDRARSLLVARRTETPHAFLFQVVGSFDALDKAMDAAGRAGMALLIDFRAAPARNDADYERASVGQPERCARGFARVAVLVRTATGMLQVQRAVRGLPIQVFGDENEAIAYLTSLAPPPSSGRPSRPSRV